MRRGSISIGEMKCDICSGTIVQGERYLILEEEKKSEQEGEKAKLTESPPQRLCLNCCIKRKYVSKKKEKGVEVYSFFAD